MNVIRTNIVYAEVNLDFNTETFIKEFDSYILPHCEPFVPVYRQWSLMRDLNPIWQIIPNHKFTEYDNIIKNGGTDFHGMTHYWRAVNLMQGENDAESSVGVGAGWRSAVRHQPTVIKDQFKELSIVNWINKNIPAKRVVGIHCVSINPGEFATVHRDAFWGRDGPNPALNNGFFREGFVVMCLNISNGGVPFLWALDDQLDSPIAADAKCYIGSDYFIHGVPTTSSLRRQVRVSFEPRDEFYALLNESTIISIPNDYQFKNSQN